MSSETSYDPLDTDVPNRVLGFVRSRIYPSMLPNILVDADVSAVYVFDTDTDLVARKYWLADPPNNRVIAMSSQQMTLVDQRYAASLLTSERSVAEADVTTPFEIGKLERAVADITVQEFNVLINWMISVQAAIAAATSLANLQTRIAAINTPNVITLAAVKTAIINDIAAGNVD